MLIEKATYRRNEKTGDIVKRQEVELQCDDCKKHWTTLYDYVKRKRKLNDYEDYCASCRAKHREKKKNKLNRRKVAHIEVKCLGCDKEFFRCPSKVRKNNFCSLKCRDEYNIVKKYGHLFDTFKSNPDEVAYLFGLILGDGHSRKVDQKNTTRICIAFDAKYNDLIEMFKIVAEVLEINYFIEPQKHRNCQVLGFVLPDKLLEIYGMRYDGAKYDNQPTPIDGVVNNINFAVGLINSDGWCGYTPGRNSDKEFKKIGFCNTVFSIAETLKRSLECNGIEYRTYHRDGIFDKRTEKINKEQWVINISKKNSINKLNTKSSYNLKEFK